MSLNFENGLENGRNFPCKSCHKYFKYRSNLSRHVSSVHRKSDDEDHFTCDSCHKRFNHRSNLLRHISAVHRSSDDEDDFICDLCNKRFNHRSKLLRHMSAIHQSHDEENHLICNSCNKRFNHRSNLMRHISTVHGISDDANHFVCEFCRKNFKNRYNLSRHVSAVHQSSNKGDRYVCDLCHKSFTHRSNLSRHISSIHKNNDDGNRFTCEFCPKSFNHRSNLLRHSSTVHRSTDNEDRFICEFCSKHFNYRSNLSRHVSNVHQNRDGGGRFVCEFCDKRFKDRSNLSRHISTIHRSSDDGDVFVCDLCYKCFKYRFHLSRHMLTVHRSSEDEDYCVCESCGKCFNGLSSLSRHMSAVHRRQDDDDCFTCDMCKKTFKWKNSLAKHIKNHEVENNGFFQCETCRRNFTSKRILHKHIREQHESVLAGESRSALKYYECNECLIKLACKRNLVRHIEAFHSPHKRKEELRQKPRTFKCLNCDEYYQDRSALGNHYRDVHNIGFNFEYLIFQSIAEFEKWMQPCYRVVCKWETQTDVVKRYRCHRSGTYEDSCKKNNTQRKRHLKVAGSKKLQGFCPGEVTVRQRRNDGLCIVTHQKVHVGHNVDDEKELRHIHLTKSQKKEIASQLVKGVPKEAILREIYQAQRPATVCAVKQRTETTAVERQTENKNVKTRVDAFVSKHKSSVLFLKDQGDVDATYGVFKRDDFVLVFQDDIQRESLLKYGHKVVSFDATHVTSADDFVLHTLLVMDSENEGVPVAFALCNRRDVRAVVDVFVRCVRNSAGVICTQALMTDTDDACASSWNSVMGVTAFSLYCPWHVRRVWRTQLDNVAAGSRKDRQTVIGQLRAKLHAAVNELDETLFIEKLISFLSVDDPIAAPFVDYFRRNFVNETQRWALCYRSNPGANFNMHIEAFHRALRSIVGKGLRIETLAVGLSCIDEYLRYRNRKSDVNAVRPVLTVKQRKLRRRHKEAIEYAKQYPYTIECVKENELWHVGSFGSQSDGLMVEMYSVQKLAKNEFCGQDNCPLLCTYCRKCFHEYQCSCYDSAVLNNMCRHIHALSFSLRTVQTKEDDTMRQDAVVSSANGVEIGGNKHIDVPVVLVESVERDDSSNKLFDTICADFKEVLTTMKEVIDPEDNALWSQIRRQFLNPLVPTLKALKKTTSEAKSSR